MKPKVLPAELMNELFSSLPFENAFGLLTKMPNGLLARNIQTMIKSIKMAMKDNKFNQEDCGPKISISEDGLVAKHIGSIGFNCVHVVLPIPALNLNGINKPVIAFYYEVQILNKSSYYGTGIGFCDQKFQLDGNVQKNNSFGIWCKNRIWIDGSYIKFGNDGGIFDEEDFVGLGIIYQSNTKMECFATCNGKLIGKAKLPSKFANLQLFHSIGLYMAGDSIRAHFKKEEWKFTDFQLVLE